MPQSLYWFGDISNKLNSYDKSFPNPLELQFCLPSFSRFPHLWSHELKVGRLMGSCSAFSSAACCRQSTLCVGRRVTRIEVLTHRLYFSANRCTQCLMSLQIRNWGWKPNRPFHNFKVSRSGDQERGTTNFKPPNLWKGWLAVGKVNPFF